MVGRGGLEPPTSRLSGVRSNHLSYRPIHRPPPLAVTGRAWLIFLKRYEDGPTAVCDILIWMFAVVLRAGQVRLLKASLERR